jgi:hypothetical protein
MSKSMMMGLVVLVAGSAWAQEPDFGALLQAFAGAAQAPQATNAAAMVSVKALKAALPAALPGWERVEAGAEKQSALGMSTVMATGVYEGGEKTIRMEITDLGGMGGLGALARMGAANSEVDNETRTGFERTTTYQGFKALESYDKMDKSGEIELFVGTRFSVTLNGSNLDSFDDLAAAIQAMDLKALSELKPEAAPAQ